MKIQKQVLSRIFSYYKMCLVKSKFIKNKYSKNQCIEYVKYVNLILTNMKPEYAMLLKEVYINNKHLSQLPFSQSSFYLKIKKASFEFINYYC